MKRGNFFKTLVLTLLSLAMIMASATAAFNDLGTSWANEDIEALNQKGVYSGMVFEDSSLFRPDSPISRADFLLMLFNAMGLDLKARDTSLTAPFTDYEEVPEVYRPYLIEGYRRGVLLGRTTDSGEVYSDWKAPLTRQEAVTILGRILNAYSSGPLPFTDRAQVASWARDYLAAQVDKGVINGLPNGSFAPLKSLTRAEASHIVRKLLDERLFIPTEMRLYAGNTDLGIVDGARIEGTFGTPFGLALDGENTLLVADRDANLLRRITQTMVTTIGGQTKQLDINGLPGSGYKDSVAANLLMMSGPRYICKAGGVVYYTDGGNNAVRMIDAAGNGYTIAGNGKAGYSNGVRENTQFNLPSGIAIDANGTIYVADTLNNCIRTISSTGTSALFAGVPGADGGYKDGAANAALFCQPTDIQFGSDGALYVADTGNSMIRVIRGGQVSTLAGSATPREELSGAMEGGFLDGAADKALFRGPLGIYVTRGDVVFVADTENNVIRKIEGGHVVTVAGNLKAGNSTGPALVAMLNSPVDVVAAEGKDYVSDSNNHCIKVFGTDLGD